MNRSDHGAMRSMAVVWSVGCMLLLNLLPRSCVHVHRSAAAAAGTTADTAAAAAAAESYAENSVAAVAENSGENSEGGPAVLRWPPSSGTSWGSVVVVCSGSAATATAATAAAFPAPVASGIDPSRR